MKIGILYQQSISAARRCINEAKALQSVGHKVTIICDNDHSAKEITSENNVQRILYPKSKILKKLFALDTIIPLFSLIWFIRLRSNYRKHSFDVIIAHDYPMLRVAKWFKKFNDVKVVLNTHENYPHAFMGYTWHNKIPLNFIISKDYWIKKESALISNIDGYIFMSKVYADEMISNYSLDEKIVTVYPNVPDLSLFQTYNEPCGFDLSGSFNILYFGRIGERRGLQVVFESMPQLLKEIKDLEIVLVGPVDSDYSMVFNQQLSKYKENILYISWLEMKKLVSLANQCHIGISPLVKNKHHDSTIANKVFQYMLLKLPMVVSDVKPQQHLIDECDSGLTHVHNSPKSFAKAVIKIYNMKEDDIQKMKRNGLKKIKEKYNFEIMSKNIINLIDKM